MYKNKLFNIFKIILIQTFVYLSIFSCLSNTDDKNSVSIDTTSISAKSEATSTAIPSMSTAIPSMPTAIPPTATAIPPTATPNAKKLQEIDPKALDLVINYAKNQCSYFESIVEGNQVISVSYTHLTLPTNREV